jgi:putative methionine-R-sulfoxide reductase with GAF domain
VFDVDSFDVGAFDESDVTGLQAVMEAAGLTTRRAWNDRIDTV